MCNILKDKQFVFKIADMEMFKSFPAKARLGYYTKR